MKSLLAPVLLDHHKLPKSLVHGDLFSDNALMSAQGLVGVIDFFNASWSPRLLDLAICLMDWCWHDSHFDEQRLRALVGAFRQKCEPLSSLEFELWPELVRLAAFRFWCTRQEYVLSCSRKKIAPAANRSPVFCESVFQQVFSQEHLLRDVWAY